MKDATFTLEFTTHVLANGVGPDGERDRFQRDSKNRMIWQQSWWYSAFSRAIELAGVKHIKAADISMDLAVEAPTEIFDRKYGRDEHRKHEAIMPGTEVTFSAVVADHITESNLSLILDRLGRFVGLSPYGHKLGYGKSSVIAVNVAPSEASEVASEAASEAASEVKTNDN